MKVLILTLGTRGDVQPFVALARGLQDAGHEAVVAAPRRFAEFMARHRVAFAGVDDGPMRLMDNPAEAGAVIEGGLRARLAQARAMPEMFTQVLADCWAVASDGPGAGADVIVHNGQILAGQHVAEALSVPAVLALPSPVYLPTRAFPWPGQALPTWLPAALNRVTYVGMKAPAVIFGRVVDRWRQQSLELPRRRGRHDPLRRPDGGPAPVLHAFSPQVVVPPPDWPPQVETTGYWFPAPSPEPLPPAVEQFLAAGDPPVFGGFGSMSGGDCARTTTVVLQAASRAGVRLIVGTGWGGLTAVDGLADVLVVNEVDHHLLFPRVTAVVHHGGAGTTGTAFAAGRPQVVCPFVADQPFWGRLTHQGGVAPPPLAQRRLDPVRLADALNAAVTNPDLARHARHLGARVRAEDGVTTAINSLERIVDTGARETW